jgi:prepilin-type N-terminal cleavage/methylation domain-containing protein
MKINRMKYAFTLVELLVVISVIAILLAILMPALSKARESAKRITCATNIRTLNAATIMYAGEYNNKIMPTILRANYSQARTENRLHRTWFTTTDTTGEVKEIGTGRGGGYFWNLGVLWRNKLIKEGKIFFCTTNFIDKWYSYEAHANPSFPRAIQPTDGSGWGVRVSYAYNPESVSTHDSTASNRLPMYSRLTEIKSGTILIVDNLYEKGAPHSGGWNLGWGDGSVTYFKNKLVENIIKSGNFSGSGPACYDKWDTIINRMRGALSDRDLQ